MERQKMGIAESTGKKEYFTKTVKRRRRKAFAVFLLEE